MTIEFSLEVHLMDILEASTADVLRSSGDCEMLVFSQVAVGATIPDLVIVRQPPPRPTEKRVRLSDFEAWIVAELWGRGALREPTLTRRLYTRSERMQLALHKLERLGLVRRTAAGGYVLTDVMNENVEVLAVEAKLTRWREAIAQARDYLRFSTASYVALPESVVESNRDIAHACKQAHVGLLAVSAAGVRVVSRPPRRNEPLKRDFVRVLSRTVGIVLT
jgi:hypothetical protein